MKNNKSLGQHWLKNRFILDDIADLAATGMDRETICLEIGPGLGTLTSSLLRRFQRVVAVEYDEKLAKNLPKSFPGKNLAVLNADILSIDIGKAAHASGCGLVADSSKNLHGDSQASRSATEDQNLGTTEDDPYQTTSLDLADLDQSRDIAENGSYVVAGNIPYYITSPILRQVLTATPRPRRIVLLIQKEVAQRICAGAGKQSVLSLFVQNLAEVEAGPVVPAREFTPPPQVDSQIVILQPRTEAEITESTFELIKRGFSNPRKKLATNLGGFRHTKTKWQGIMSQHGLDPDLRAQDLSLASWAELDKS